MKLKTLSLVAALSLAAALLAWWTEPHRANVVVVVIDTLRQDHLATYGYARQTAPFLDRLARDGAVFAGLSPSSWTKPATASLLTGLHPLRHQAVGRLDALPAPVATLAERLRDAGYQTLGMSANGWVSAAFGFDQGFAELILRDSVAHAEDVNRLLLPRLDALTPPFFLYVHYVDPHAPYEPRTAWDGGALPAAVRAQGPLSVESLDAFTVRQRPRELLERARELYDGEIRGADRGLAGLVRELKKRGLFEDTILVVTSDHGEELEDHGRMSHGLSLYEEAVRVPLVLYAPHRIVPGRHGAASLLDVMPTLEDLLELPPVAGRESLDGVSQAALLRGGAPEPAGPPRPFLFHLDQIDGAVLALARGGEKIVLGRRPFHKELFDLRADPGERRNLLPEEGGAARFSPLALALATGYNDLSRRALPRREPLWNGDLMGKLAALGYTQPGRSGDPRRIPRRIEPADTAPLGLLGWEGTASLPGCVTLAEDGAERQLLRGWFRSEVGGRWSRETGVALLGVPPGGGRLDLVLAGNSFRPDAPRVTVTMAGRPVLDAVIPPGPFELRAPAGRLPADGPAIVELATDPLFVPSPAGTAGDKRSLGMFLTSICLEAARVSAAPARPAHAPAP